LVDPLQLGTSDFFFVEKNEFDWNDWYGTTGAVTVDFSNGGRVVFRYNSSQNAMFETHDRARTVPQRECLGSLQQYLPDGHKQMERIGHNSRYRLHMGDQLTGDWTVPIGAMNYKSSDPRGIPRCDGVDPADQNTPGQAGWRCEYQIGSQGKGSTAIGYPAYIWNNAKNGDAVGMVCTAGCEYLREGRDFVNSGSMPKPGYTPYTYPHPLQNTEPTGPSDASARP
jgi:hypothetical protein